MSKRYPCWMYSHTHYTLERSGTPLDVDGHKLGEHTGHVICEECYRSADHIEDIRHAEDCLNREQLGAGD